METAEATMQTLTKCRNEESFQMAWSRAEILSQTIKMEINGPVFPLKMPVHRQLESHRVVYRLLLASNFVDQNLVQPSV